MLRWSAKSGQNRALSFLRHEKSLYRLVVYGLLLDAFRFYECLKLPVNGPAKRRQPAPFSSLKSHKPLVGISSNMSGGLF